MQNYSKLLKTTIFKNLQRRKLQSFNTEGKSEKYLGLKVTVDISTANPTSCSKTQTPTWVYFSTEMPRFRYKLKNSDSYLLLDLMLFLAVPEPTGQKKTRQKCGKHDFRRQFGKGLLHSSLRKCAGRDCRPQSPHLQVWFC